MSSTCDWVIEQVTKRYEKDPETGRYSVSEITFATGPCGVPGVPGPCDGCGCALPPLCELHLREIHGTGAPLCEDCADDGALL